MTQFEEICWDSVEEGEKEGKHEPADQIASMEGEYGFHDLRASCETVEDQDWNASQVAEEDRLEADLSEIVRREGLDGLKLDF